MQNKGAGILITDYIKTLGDRRRILKMKTYQILKELMFLGVKRTLNDEILNQILVKNVE